MDEKVMGDENPYTDKNTIDELEYTISVLKSQELRNAIILDLLRKKMDKLELEVLSLKAMIFDFEHSKQEEE